MLVSDFGDAPDTTSGTGLGNYQTFLAYGGPSHVIDSTQTKLFLGARVDGEANATPNAAATGDDLAVESATDDEDGVFDPANDLWLTLGTSPVVRVRATNTTGSPATLYGWIDLNRNGVFDNVGERSAIEVPTGTINQTFRLTFPTLNADGPFGNTFARFRLSSDIASSQATGVAVGGEVEDYQATIYKPSTPLVDYTKTKEIAKQTNGGPQLAVDDRFGDSTASLGDINGDGIPDLAVAALGDGADYFSPQNHPVRVYNGAVYVLLMNSNGTAKVSSTIRPTNLDRHFGRFLAPLGDFNGDGVNDLAIGSYSGMTILSLTPSGTEKSRTFIPQRFFSATSIGDLDGDGVTDLAVGSPYTTVTARDSGAVDILFLNRNGTIKASTRIADGINGGPTSSVRDRLGYSVASLGDLDGDGVTDIAVGAEGDNTGEYDRGAVHVLFLNSNGTVKQRTKISSRTGGGPETAGIRFGADMASLGDQDGDGNKDLVVSDQYENVYILLMDSNGTAKSTTRITQQASQGISSGAIVGFGGSLASLGDLNSDGMVDLAVGTPQADIAFTSYVYPYLSGPMGATLILYFTPMRMDFGDAPSPYPVYIAEDGARHAEKGPRLGANRDGESNGVHSATANADDTIFWPDDDGVTLEAIRVGASQTSATVNVQNAPSGAKLNAWIDFNGDGSWSGPTEQIADDVAVVNGNNTLRFDVPIDARTGISFARFRLSTTGNLEAGGAASDGEVEDYQITIVDSVDFGDAPDTGTGTGRGNYQTLVAGGGPSHIITSTRTRLFLGARVDGEGDPIPNPQANGDDVSVILPDDEDGLVEPLQDLLVTAGSAPVVRVRATNTTTAASTVYGWIDFNRDGVFDNQTERASAAVPAGSIKRTFSLTFPAIPISDNVGPTYARFRLSSDPAAANSTGAASGGEIEDYAATISRPSQGVLDAARTIKITRNTNGGPPLDNSHYYGSSVAALGDLNKDGVPDLAVGSGSGINVQFMNSNGTVKSHTTIAGGWGALASIGDLDGDGVVDLAAANMLLSERSQGAVEILLLNSNGTVKSRVEIGNNRNGGPLLGDRDSFGNSLAGLGDLDGDGIADLAVSASYDNSGTSEIPRMGVVHVLLMNSNGTVKSTKKLASGQNGMPSLSDPIYNGSWFGASLTSLGDQDGDGVTDLAVGVPSFNHFGYGTFFVLNLNSDGTAKGGAPMLRGTQFGLRTSSLEQIGYAGTSVGDLDGDEITDIAVQSYGYEGSQGFHAGVQILFLNADKTIKASQEVLRGVTGDFDSATSKPQYDQLGITLASLGDLDGDGISELAVGAPTDDSAGNYDGAVYILFLKPTPPKVTLSQVTNQGAGTATITARLNYSTKEPVVVDLAWSGTANGKSDYSRSGSQIVIPAGSTSGSVSLTFLPDTVDEAAETVIVDIAGVTNGTESGNQQVTITIDDDDPSPISVTRSNGVLTIANVGGIATDIRIGLDAATSRLQVESLTDGMMASLFRSPLEGLRGVVVNLGPQSDRFNASTIVLPITVNGGAGNDTIVGGAWTDLLNGEAGADSIIAGGGRDTVSGGVGDDTLDGGASIDLLMEVGDVSFTLTSASLSGLGSDQFIGFEAANLTGGNSDNTIDASAAGFSVGINGGVGADTLLGSNFADTLNAGTGNDALFGYGGRDLLMGGAGNDVLDGGSSEDTLDGDTGTDTVRRKNDLNFTVTSSALVELIGDAVLSTDKLSGVEAVVIMGGPSANRIDVSGFAGVGGTIIQGNGGNDTVIGSDGSDVITTTDGDDSINARGGNDVVRSGAGADSLVGGAGNDLLDGEAGADTIAGEAGNDALIGGEGSDSLSGGSGADMLAAITGADVLSGGDGDDQLLGGDGAETLRGDDGNDRLFGSGGNDSLDGGAGADTLQGEAGADTVTGGAGDDQLSGGANVDVIDGGEGSNRLNELVDGNVSIEGTRITSAALGNESLLNISRIILNGGAGDNLFDARLASVSVQLAGNAGNDILLGGRRADTILGGEGNDVISGGGSVDVLSGGNGFDDWLEEADANFTVNGITVTSEMTGSERVTDIERITVIGGDRANMIDASRAGVPVILIGGRGNDTLLGGSLADTLSGGNRNDLPVNDGEDSLNGGVGVDVLENDLRDRLTLGADDSKIADIFTLLPSWIDAL